MHLEAWVQARVLANKDAYLPFKDKGDRQRSRKEDFRRDKEKTSLVHVGATITKSAECPLCKGNHKLWKCEKYKEMTPNKKLEQVKKFKLCFNCLNPNHITSSCASRNKCFAQGCSRKHHTTLHEHYVGTADRKEPASEVKNLEIKGEKPEEKPAFNGMVKSTSAIYLQVVPVKLMAPNGNVLLTYALLDSGSQTTLIKEDAAKMLKMNGNKKSIRITTIKDAEESLAVREVSLEISSRDEEYRLKIESAYVVPPGKFHMPSQPPVDHLKCDIYTHLDGIEVDAVKADDISILVGANVPEAFLHQEIRRGSSQQPLAVRTNFGWTLFGASRLQMMT